MYIEYIIALTNDIFVVWLFHEQQSVLNMNNKSILKYLRSFVRIIYMQDILLKFTFGIRMALGFGF